MRADWKRIWPIPVAGAIVLSVAAVGLAGSPAGPAAATGSRSAVGGSPAASAPALGALAPAPGSSAAAGEHAVAFAGRRFEVPASWQVVDLRTDPTACVRFDVHAVYVGTPGANENCPAQGVGRPEGALLVSSAPAGTSSQVSEDQTGHRIVASAPGITVQASYGDDRSTVLQILGSAQLTGSSPTSPPAPATKPAQPIPTGTGSPAGSAQPSAGPDAGLDPASPTPSATPTPSAIPTGPATRTPGSANPTTMQYSGLGFDTCAAPSAATMKAWAASPFVAVGVYIGGSNRACAQPNLTAAWVAQQAEAGWHFLPLYAGPEAVDGDITAPQSQGTQSADDAVVQAKALGLQPGAVLYYDMEAYPATQTAVVQPFLAAWTKELHADGYLSGVYGSLNSAIHDVVSQWGLAANEPDVLNIADWNGQADADPAATPASEWVGRRVHQFLGGANDSPSYGGVSIDIDQDYSDLMYTQCDISVVPLTPGPTPTKTPTGTADKVPGCLTNIMG